MGIMLACFIMGIVLAFRNSRRDGKRVTISVGWLIVGYAAVFGMVVEKAYGGHSSTFDMMGSVDWSYLIWPTVLLLGYSLFRAIICRFSRVRQSFPATFVATLRYGSVLAAAVFAIAYAVLMPITVLSGARADTLVRNMPANEAAAIHDALR